MTHPDDEISICAWIKRLTQAGVDVWISWTHSNPERQREAIRAALKLGVARDNLIFHGGPDGAIMDDMAAHFAKFQAMIETVKPDRIVCGAFEQGHLDHDATNALVAKSFDGPIYEVPFYYSYLTRLPRVNRFSQPTGEEILELSEAEKEWKMDYAQSFPSQAIWRNMIFAEAAARLSGDGSLMTTERMRLQAPVDYLRPNHEGELAERIVESSKWAAWGTAYRRFLVDINK